MLLICGFTCLVNYVAVCGFICLINYVAYCGFICLIHPVALCFRIMYGEQARYFDMEVSPRIKHKKRGLLSMVNNGSGMHGSQVKYFIYIIRFKLVTGAV